MLVHSLGAYFNDAVSENLADSWNIAEISSQHICTSLISGKMVGTADIPFLCYGFSNMSNDSLIHSGTHDIGSGVRQFIPLAYSKDEKYLKPENMIDQTTEYSEICYRRIQNGKKKQPDFLVAFKKHGVTANMDNIMKAVHDFREKGIELPIVIVDVDKCMEMQVAKYNELKSLYEKEQSQTLLEQIKNIYHNIKNTDITIANDLDYKFVMNYEEKKIAERNENVNIKSDMFTIAKNNCEVAELLPDKIEEIIKNTQTILEDYKKIDNVLDKTQLIDYMQNTTLYAEIIAEKENLTDNEKDILREVMKYHVISEDSVLKNNPGSGYTYDMKFKKNSNLNKKDRNIAEAVIKFVNISKGLWDDSALKPIAKECNVSRVDLKKYEKLSKIVFDSISLETLYKNEYGVSAPLYLKTESGKNFGIPFMKKCVNDLALIELEKYEQSHLNYDCSMLFDEEQLKETYKNFSSKYEIGSPIWVLTTILPAIKELPLKKRVSKKDLQKIDSMVSEKEKSEMLQIIKDEQSSEKTENKESIYKKDSEIILNIIEENNEYDERE